MSNLSEAMRWMNEPELPTAEDLREQIVNAVMYSVHGAEGECVQDVVSGLIQTYEALVIFEGEANDDDFQLRYVEPIEAERIMLASYTKACVDVVRRVHPDCDAESVTEGYYWPDALVYKRHGHTVALMRAIGRALGYYDGRGTVSWFEHCKARGDFGAEAGA